DDPNTQNLFVPLSWAYDGVNRVIGIIGGTQSYPGTNTDKVWELTLDLTNFPAAAPVLMFRYFAAALPIGPAGPVCFDTNPALFSAVGSDTSEPATGHYLNSIVTWNAATHTLGSLTMANAIPPMSPTDTVGQVSQVYYAGGAHYDPATKMILLFHFVNPWKV